MKTKILFVCLVLFVTSKSFAKDIEFTFENKTEQDILNIEYWLGSITESNSPNLQYFSKGPLSKNTTKKIIIDFHKRKRNVVIIKAYLKGGGYIKQKYNIDKGEKNPSIHIIHISEKIPTDEFNKMKTKFTELKLDGENIKASEVNGINALIGSIIVYDKNDEIIHKIDPTVLKTKVTSTSLPDLKQKIEGIFSSETAISGDVKLPFVSLSSSFSTGDVAKFLWEIEDVGQFNWSSSNGKSLAQLFYALPQETKDVLVQLYTDNPDAKMKFIDQAFMIGRLEVTTKKTRKISSNTELNASNFVTGKGNYLFLDDLTDEFVVKDVITEISGFNASGLLKTMYLFEKSKVQNSITSANNERIKAEYHFLIKLYPEFLKPTTDINVMKKAIRDLNENQENQLLFINRTLDKEQIKLKNNFEVSSNKNYEDASNHEQKGFDYLFKKNLENSINSFIQSENSYNSFHQVYEIANYLKSLKDKTDIDWKSVYSEILSDFSYGMTEKTKSKLKEKIK